MAGVQVGQIIPEHVFYRLTATDLSGREWTSTHLYPIINTVQGGSLCTGELREIVQENSLQVPIKHEHLYLEIHDKIEIPCNTWSATMKTVAGQELNSSSLNVLRFDASGYEITIQKESDALQIRTLAKGARLEEYFEVRIIEALQFVVARPVFWSVMQKWTSEGWKICIRPSRPNELQPRIGTPLSNTPDSAESFCRMFENYLQYILTGNTGEKMHPISAQMHAICRASTGSIEAQALTLSVAIESILKYVHDSKYELSQEKRNWIEKAKSYFASWEGPNDLSERITGLLSMLHTSSASIRLRELVELKVIADSQEQAWRKIRHKFAHGEALGSLSRQEFLDLTNTELVLFYQLVFYAIGYRGKYTDYSLPGWPTKEYSAPTRNVSGSD